MAVPGLVPAPATLAALDQATKIGPAVAAREAALALVLATLPVLVPEEAAEAALVEATNLAQVLVTLTALVPAISPAAAGTRGQFRDE
jgi:hypothetical protein